MPQKFKKKEKTMDLQKNNVILQLTRLLEHQNLITNCSGKDSDYASRDLCPLQYR